MSFPDDGAPPTSEQSSPAPCEPPAARTPVSMGAADPTTIRFRWSVACVVALAAVAFGLNARGHAARISFDPPPELAGHRWASVGDAGDAVRVWMTSGVRGRRLLVLTGRWSKPRTVLDSPVTEADVTRLLASGPRDYLDADAALWFATTRGIARTLDVVMPLSALERRRAEVSGSRPYRPFPGGFAHPFDALERTFSTPDAYRPSPEPLLILVEPSFLGAGAPPDVRRWVEHLGVRFDLALVALDDPAATDAQREEARRLVAELQAPFVEVAQ